MISTQMQVLIDQVAATEVVTQEALGALQTFAHQVADLLAAAELNSDDTAKALDLAASLKTATDDLAGVIPVTFPAG